MVRAKYLNSHQEILWVCFKLNSKYIKEILLMFRTEGSDRIEGIVYKVNEDQITVSFREMHDFVIINLFNNFNQDSLKQPLALVILANEITHKRCKEALETIR